MRKAIRLLPFIVMVLDGGGFKGHSTLLILFLSLLNLCIAVHRRGCLVCAAKKPVVCLSVVFAGALIAALTGIDKGESIFGLIRLITVIVLAVSLQQAEREDKELYLASVPILGIFLLICGLFLRLPVLSGWVSASKRLAGPFQYANTMALFLLIGIVSAEHFYGRGKRAVQFVLAVGVVFTGSRAAFGLMTVYLVYVLISTGGKNKYLIISLALTAAIALVLMAIMGNGQWSMRSIKFDIYASTLQGRLLYWEDAVRMLSRRPLGLGYMGYFYLQQAEQTGVYSVRFVHNELIQWALDYGIISLAGLIGYLCSRISIKIMPRSDLELFFLIAAYSLFDFHLQYLSIVFIVLLLIPKGTKTVKIDRRVTYLPVIPALFMLTACLAAECYAAKGNYLLASALNPLSSQYKQERLLGAKSLEAADDYAGELLKNNGFLYFAYYIRADAAAQRGQIEDYIRYRKQGLSLRKYHTDEYEVYFEQLLSFYLKAKKDNDSLNMDICRAAMEEIPEIINDVRSGTAVRAYYLDDKPYINFDEEYLRALELLQLSF